MVINGESLWRANKTVKYNGTSRRITGTGSSRGEARERLESNYRRWLTKTGQVEAAQLKTKAASSEITTAEWLYKWHEQIDPERVDETTRARYKKRIELHLAPHIGHIPLRSLSRDQIETLFRVDLPSKRKIVGGKITNDRLLSGSTLFSIFTVLNMALKRAFVEEKIAKNPILGVQAPLKNKKTEVDTGTGLAASLMINLQDHPRQAMWTLAIIYGLRQSERLGLRWRDINLNPSKPTMKIRGQLARKEVFHGCGIRNTETLEWPCGQTVGSKCPQKSGGGGYFWKDETKTISSRRELPIIEPVRSMLFALKIEQQGLKETSQWNPLNGDFMDELVFTTNAGKPITQQADTKEWRAMLSEFGITHVRAHSLRHLAVSLLIGELNVPIEVVSKIMGHASTAVTHEVYTHLQAEQQRKPLEAVGDYFTNYSK